MTAWLGAQVSGCSDRRAKSRTNPANVITWAPAALAAERTAAVALRRVNSARCRSCAAGVIRAVIPATQTVTDAAEGEDH